MRYKTIVERRKARREDQLGRLEKIDLNYKKIAMHRAEAEKAEKNGELEKLRVLKKRIRELEQQIKYMA